MNMLLLAAFRLRFVESGCEFPTLTFFPEDADVAALDLQRNPAANGWNRQHGHCLIDADSDVEAVRTW
jgi:hypothetical protein